MSNGIMLAPGEYEGEGGEIMRPQQVSNSALTSLVTAEINSQIAFAQSRPRSVKQFMVVAKDLACLTEEVAQSCIYALPRGGKPIEGPSVRLAEIVAYAWGNLRISSRITSEGAKFLTAQTTVLDLERNTGIQIEVQRRCTDRNGKRYNDDMMVVTGNAAISISLRNAIWKIVPAAFVTPIYRDARKLAAGEGKSMEARRKGVLDWIRLLNVKPEELYTLLSVKGIEEVTTDHMILLAGYKSALTDGETTVDQIFRSTATTAPAADSDAAGLPAPDGKMAKMAQELTKAAQAAKGDPHSEAVVTVTPQPASVAPPQTFNAEIAPVVSPPSVVPNGNPVIDVTPTSVTVTTPVIAQAPFEPTKTVTATEPDPSKADDEMESYDDSMPVKVTPAPKTAPTPKTTKAVNVPGQAPWLPRKERDRIAKEKAQQSSMLPPEGEARDWSATSGSH